MYTAHITMTGKGYSSKEEWSVFAEDIVSAVTLTALTTKLVERYGKSWKHKKPMYRDTKDRGTIKIGWVIGFHAADWSHSPVTRWRQQDWVSITECKDVEL